MADRGPKRWRRVLLGIGGALGLLLIIMVVKMLATPSRQLEPRAFEPLAVDRERAIANLQAAVQLQTISDADPAQVDRAPFEALHALLRDRFPRVHASLEREVVAELSLVYRWPGRDPDAAPILLLAHQDVVPIEAPERWSHPPFAGERAGGFVWGRGTMDDKGNLMAILEAVEALLADGYQPRRTIYLCFGHDEEVGGTGAVAIAARFAERGVRAQFALDEGMGVTDGLFPGMDHPLAIVGIAEKGFVTLELRAQTEGGHGSSPPEHTAIGVLAEAITRVEANPMPARLAGPFRQTLEVAAPEMKGPIRLVASNLWLLRPVLKRVLLGKPKTAATVRTTTAVTVVEGGVKDNVLPTDARALVNHRLNPGDTVDDVVEHVRRSIDDERVSVTVVVGREASRISSAESEAFSTVALALREALPGISVAPGLYVAGADARFYEDVADDVYRISPFLMNADDTTRYHGVDERIAEDAYLAMIQFYGRILSAHS